WFDRREGGFPRPRRTPEDPDFAQQAAGPDLAAAGYARRRRQGEPMPLRETRRILLDGNVVDVVRHDQELVAGDGRKVGIDEAVHLPPTIPSKIICGHLNYSSRS